ncbi:hypothetical protein [Pseudomonas sp. TWRC1-2]|uniref:hypothetical protein n=1 Tax=Pseudomonas sp. TWRC1-2 TaxID=2804628 RepID=UPI003CF6E51D
MSIEAYRRQVISHQQAIARLQSDKGKVAAKAAVALKKKQDASSAAARTSNASTRSSKEREAVRHADDHGKAVIEIARIESKIADEQKRLVSAQGKVAQEEARNQKKVDDARKKQDVAQKKRDDDLKKQQVADKRAGEVRERQMNHLNAGLVRHEHMHAATAQQIEMLKALPERITVLFFASDPVSGSSSPLALDEEARSIQQGIRASEYRDSVNFQTRWAVQAMDILQAINELKPTVVHFSGHGTPNDELVLKDDQGGPWAISKEAMVNAIAVSSRSVRLVFFNTCFSYNQAKGFVGKIDAAIGMNRGVGDYAARIFSSQFYSSIGFGLSIPMAFDQAKAMLMMMVPEEADIPELHYDQGKPEEELVLVSVPTA